MNIKITKGRIKKAVNDARKIQYFSEIKGSKLGILSFEEYNYISKYINSNNSEVDWDSIVSIYSLLLTIEKEING